MFALDRGGIVGEDGPTHHGLFDLSYLRNIPNLVLMAPKDENELRRMLVTAVSYPGPVALRYPRGRGTGVVLDSTLRPLAIGKSEILTTGDDVIIIAIGHSVQDALTAAKELKDQHGVSATVINSRFVKPLDVDLITKLVKRIPRIITVEENVLAGGFGSAVLEAINDAEVEPFRLKRIGVPDIFVEHGAQKTLRKQCQIDVEDIIDAALILAEKSSHPAEKPYYFVSNRAS